MDTDTEQMYDLIVVGAGPIGLAASCAAQDVGLNYLCIDKQGICQTISEFAPRQSFYSPADELEVGGVPFAVASDEKPRREDAIAYYRAVVASRMLNLHTWERVLRLRKVDDHIELQTQQEPDDAWRRTYKTHNVLLASGVWDQPRRLEIPGAGLKKVRVRYEDPTPYYSKICLVIGGGNSAAEVAMALARAGAQTAIAMLEESWDACKLRPFVMRELLMLIEEKRITPYFSTRATKITTSDVSLLGQDGVVILPNDFVFTMIGNVPDVKFLAESGIQMQPDDLKPIYDAQTFETNVAGVYVAGSISREPHIFSGRPRAVRIVRQIALQLRKGVALVSDGNQNDQAMYISEAEAPIETSVG